MLTPNTVTDPQLLKAELAEAKVRGYAIDNCEIYADLRCVAVPIHDADGGVIAALSCSGATDVVTFEAIPGLVSELRAASAAVHAKLFPASNFRLQ
jgi:DNA-binding IclR family transcriptional regulator